MRYNENIQLKLYEYNGTQFALQAIIDDYQEVSFEHNLYEAGTFTITINYNIPNAMKFRKGLFIQFGNSPYDFGEIQRVQDSLGSNGKGSQTRTITGYDSRYILKRRVIKNLNDGDGWAMTSKGEICMRSLIADQCGVNAETKRQLPIVNTIPAYADAIGKEYSVKEQGSNLYEVCKTIATQSEIGWRLNFNGQNLTLECYEGEDRSQFVQFSPTFDSLANGEFIDTNESYSNAVYISGKGQNSQKDLYEGEDGTPNGLDRFESWADESQMTNDSEYEAKALSMLTQYGQTLQMSGNGLAKCPYIYKEQYEVGDWITVGFNDKKVVVQILSVTERWAWNKYDINFSFGKPKNNLADQLQLILRKIQLASNKGSVIDSVRWYTLPTDIAMRKEDLTFNTLGFTGNIGNSDRTFTLYFDNKSKAGSKSYSVYTKNLSGNYTLTLTTGVSGATNFTIKGGVNIVARIFVDENGNIVSQSMTATDLVESGNNQPVTSNAVAGTLQGKLNNTLSNITSSDIDNLSDTEISVSRIRNYDIGWPSDDGIIIHIPWSNSYARQIALDEESNWLAVRYKAGGSWHPWKVLSGAEEDDSSPVNISRSVSKSLGVESVTACRRNNLVYIFISGTYTGSPTYSTQPLVSGLPGKYLSKFEQYFSVVSYMSSGNIVYPSRIMVNGSSISLLETSMPNGSQIRMGFIYIGA